MVNNILQTDCKKHILAVHDAMDMLSGKWKISIIAVLCYYQKRRFTDILKEVHGISNKMLSKELKDLEQHKLISRTIIDSHPVSIEYALTDHGKELQDMIQNLSDWGYKHRKIIFEG